MIKAGIIGGAGYTAGELLRILVFHPDVEIAFVQSNSQAGKEVADLHPDLLGLIQLKFCQAPQTGADVVFLCAGHGKSEEALKSLMDDNPKIIDLSADFRLDRQNGDWVYGLVELNGNLVKSAEKIANPGCFATAIQLALLPLAGTGKCKGDIHVHAITGSTGAGVKPGETTHFSWRYSNLSVYKPFTHQHLKEINLTFAEMGEKNWNMVFIPMRGNFSRGIFATITADFQGNEEEAIQMFRSYYEANPFVVIAEDDPDLKQVVNTNRALLHIQVHEGKILIQSMIDNLLKGASGQAVQNMNLMFGLPETAGLLFKSIAF